LLVAGHATQKDTSPSLTSASYNSRGNSTANDEPEDSDIATLSPANHSESNGQALAPQLGDSWMGGHVWNNVPEIEIGSISPGEDTIDELAMYLNFS
jgi:hypothetical protein